MNNDVLEVIRGYARTGRIRYTRHAFERMADRGVKEADVGRALRGAHSCVEGGDEKWRVTGPDTDGDDLTVVVVVEEGDLVITVF